MVTGAPGRSPRRSLVLAFVAAAGGLALWFAWQVVLLAPIGAGASPAAVAAWGAGVVALFLGVHGSRARWNRPLLARARLRPPPAVAFTLALAPPLLLLLLGVSVFLLALGLAAPDIPPEPVQALLSAPGGGAAFVVLVVGVVPVIEEVGFRGWVQRPLERRLGGTAAVWITAVLFALAHGGSSLFPARLAGGVVLGAAVRATRSVWTGVVLHAAWNAGTLAIHTLFPGWDPVGAGWVWGAPAAGAAAVAALACAAGVRRLRERAATGSPRPPLPRSAP